MICFTFEGRNIGKKSTTYAIVWKKKKTQNLIEWLLKVDFLCDIPAWVLVFSFSRHRIFLYTTFSYLCASIVDPDEQRFLLCLYRHVSMNTIENTHFSLEMVPFITALEIAYSCLADKGVDSHRYGIVRGRVANKCEGRPLSLPLYLFFFRVAFCQEKKPSWFPDCSVSPSQRLMWLQGLSMGKETRALSEDPRLHLHSLSVFLVVESLLAPVCWRKALFVSVPLSALLIALLTHLVSILKLYIFKLISWNLHFKAETQTISRNQMKYSDCTNSFGFCFCIRRSSERHKRCVWFQRKTDGEEHKCNITFILRRFHNTVT